jgi:hypothetical protein
MTNTANNIIKLLTKNKRANVKLAKTILKQKYISVPQLAVLTGETPAYILNMSVVRPNARNKPMLNRCYPFPNEVDENGNQNGGPVFITNDDRCRDFIIRCNNR